MKIQERAGVVASAPTNAARAVMRYSFGMIQSTAEVFLPARKPDSFVRALKSQQFDHDVELATGAYEAGRRKKDPELGFYGGGWLLKLMCEGSKSSLVSNQKVEKIAHYVTDEGLDPVLEPYLSDEDAVMASAILKKKQPVRDGFFQRAPDAEQPPQPTNE